MIMNSIVDMTDSHSPAASMQSALTMIQDRTLCLGAEILKSLQHVRTALFDFELPYVELALTTGEVLKAKARMIECSCNELLSGYIPHASNWYMAASAAQCAKRLERVVHQSMTIAKNVNRILGLNEYPDVSSILPLYLLAEIELRDALRALQQRDMELARAVCDRDHELDSRFLAEMETVMTDMSAGIHSVQTGMSLLFILRAIERIGDHAKAMASPALSLCRLDDSRADSLPVA